MQLRDDFDATCYFNQKTVRVIPCLSFGSQSDETGDQCQTVGDPVVGFSAGSGCT